MIRLAWHCGGTFRISDEAGGCAGGRIRFAPESDWMDNANLDKARTLLAPIKRKYGDALSWGDLITFAGTVAIRSMGGTTLPQCFGRIDDADGSKSDLFGTTAEFSNTGCQTNGKCTKEHSGATTIGLIYVNPEGPLDEATGKQNPDPVASGLEIREVFGRMGFNDSMTVALVAGGHAFGKCHGDPTGVFTSGFEGPWTLTPSQWSNDFLKAMVDEEWESHTGPGGKVQWRTVNRESINKDMMRLTADLALVKDPDYKAIVDEYVADDQKLVDMFAYTWDVLMTQGKSERWLAERFCEELSMEAPQVLEQSTGDLASQSDTDDEAQTESCAVNSFSFWTCLLCVFFAMSR